MKKVFLLLMFGDSFEWTQKFIDHVQHLQNCGYWFKIFTPNKIESKGNVEVVPMTIEEFNVVTERKLGVNPGLYINERGIPSFHVTDFYVMLGAILEDYIHGFDYWGTVGMDCVIGRLDHFIPDSKLENYDVWTDDIGQFNANFVLYKNKPITNNLFKFIPHWQEAVAQKPCLGCFGKGSHTLCVTDEIGMTEVMKHTHNVKFGCPKYFLIHGHDRLETQQPPKLSIEDDGSLWELVADINQNSRHPFMGHEIAYYHFSTTKEWPWKD